MVEPQAGEPTQGETLSRASHADSSSELPIEGQTAPTAEQLAVGEVVRQRPEFWNGVLRAIGTDPRSAREIGGASGVRHSALGVGVDETEKRIVIVSASGDARSAALAQADIHTITIDQRSAISDQRLQGHSRAANCSFCRPRGNGRCERCWNVDPEFA